MINSHGIREVGYIDCPGGGQVVVVGDVAYIGSMSAPDGTIIYDVSDPKRPRELSRIGMVMGTHAHKVRVVNNIMVVNRERNPYQLGAPDNYQGGLGIYDVSNPGKPRLLADWKTHGMGVHRFDFDGRYAYISPTVKGYLGNIVMILDLIDPTQPVEVSRWWMPGQWTEGGEVPTWPGADNRCHHPLRLGNRLYTSYWFGGFVILDIEDICRPRFISSVSTSPPYPWPTHTALPIRESIQGKKIMLVADEDVRRRWDSYPSFLSIYDITNENHPIAFSSFQVTGVTGEAVEDYTGCHQPSEVFQGTEVPVAWFAYGLRVIDIANPHSPREVAWFKPEPKMGASRIQSNDVTVDHRGLIYLLDRLHGLHILERV